MEPPRPRGRPRAEHLEELESRLVRVARQCFIAHGYGATSMSEVARAARVSKTTLYARFPCKADLFRAIIDDQMQHAVAGMLRRRGPKPKTLAAVLRSYAEQTLLDSLSDDIVQLNRLIYSEAERFPELSEGALRRGRIGVQQVAQFIREYAERDGVPCRDPQTAAELFISTLRGWYSSAMLRSSPAAADDARAWVDKVLAGFLASRAAW